MTPMSASPAGSAATAAAFRGPWLACADWGTSRLRVRLLHRAGAEVATWRVAAETASDEGAGALADRPPVERTATYAAVLARHLAQVHAAVPGAPAAVPVAISGMAGSTLGWRAVPYAPLPWALTGCSAEVDTTLPPPDGASALALISGVRAAADVMRGEETELAGLHALSPAAPLWRDGWVLLPGTHCKHCRVRDGRLVDFRTAMTGELFALLARHSVLRDSVAGDERGPDSDGHFAAGVEAGAAAPLAMALFRVRARAVLEGHEGAANREFLSGVAIGSELAPWRTAEPGGTPVAVGGDPALAARYRRALDVLGLAGRLVELPTASPAGVPASVLGAAAIVASRADSAP